MKKIGILCMLFYIFTINAHASWFGEKKDKNNKTETEQCCEKPCEPVSLSCDNYCNLEENTYINSFIFTGSYILYMPLQQEIEIAQYIPTDPLTHSYEEKNLSVDYSSGFEVGLGYHYHNWAMLAKYTWLNVTNTESYNLYSWASGMNNYWTTSNETTNYSKAKWKLNYNVVTFDVKRPSYQGERLNINTLIGIKTGSIDQKMNVDATQANSNNFRSNYKSTSWLLGPRVALENSMLIAKDFSIIGDIALNLMYQYFDVKAKNYDYANPTDTNTNTANKVKIDSLTPNIDLSLGFNYSYKSPNRNNYFSASLTYDLLYYFNQNQLKRIRTINYGATQGDLMLHGLKLNLTAEY